MSPEKNTPRSRKGSRAQLYQAFDQEGQPTDDADSKTRAPPQRLSGLVDVAIVEEETVFAQMEGERAKLLARLDAERAEVASLRAQLDEERSAAEELLEQVDTE